MALVILGDALRIRYYSYMPVSSQVGINTIFYTATNIVGSPTDAQAAFQISGLVAPFYQNLQAPVSGFSGVGVSIMNRAGDLTRQLTSQVFSSNGFGPGTVGIDAEPNQVSFVIGLRSGFAARGARGRIYPPFPPDTFTTSSGNMTAAGQVALQLLAAFLQASYVVNDHAGNSMVLTPAIRHVVRQVPPLLPIVSYLPVTAAIGRSRYGTQRRRGQYGRTNLAPS